MSEFANAIIKIYSRPSLDYVIGLIVTQSIAAFTNSLIDGILIKGILYPALNLDTSGKNGQITFLNIRLDSLLAAIITANIMIIITGIVATIIL